LKEKFENKKLNTSDSKHNIPTYIIQNTTQSSSLLYIIVYKTQKHYSYLQSILRENVFTKVFKKVKQSSLVDEIREYLRGKYHCTIDLVFDWFG
jgi:hypothetical protein